MLPGKKYKPEDYLWIAWRRKWLILVPFVVVASAAFVVGRSLPDKYRSEVGLLVVPQTVPETLVRSTVASTSDRDNPRLDERIQTIKEQVLSRTRLEQVIAELNLYPKERQRLPMEDVVARMRANIDVQVVKGDTFKVAFFSDNAQTATTVASRLAFLFINENFQDRQGTATATKDFLKKEVEDAERQLNEQDQKVAAYQRAHAGELPSERPSNLQVLQNLQFRVQTIVDSINHDRDQRVGLERQLADLAIEAQTAPPPAPAPVSSDPTAVGTGSTSAQLDTLRKNLQMLLLRYKPDHPDVQTLQKRIKSLEAKLQEEELEKPLSQIVPDRPATPEEAARSNQAKELQNQLVNLDLDLKTKQAEQKRLEALIATYETRLSNTPRCEAELTALTRPAETLRAYYNGLLAKQKDSNMAANMEQRGNGERFQIIDPARLPERPFSPNRPYINLGGALAGLAVGIALIGLLEYRDMSFRSEADVVMCLSLPVLALVPFMSTSKERRQAQRRRLVLSCGAAAFVLLAATGVLAWKLGWLASLR